MQGFLSMLELVIFQVTRFSKQHDDIKYLLGWYLKVSNCLLQNLHGTQMRIKETSKVSTRLAKCSSRKNMHVTKAGNPLTLIKCPNYLVNVRHRCKTKWTCSSSKIELNRSFYCHTCLTASKCNIKELLDDIIPIRSNQKLHMFHTIGIDTRIVYTSLESYHVRRQRE